MRHVFTVIALISLLLCLGSLALLIGSFSNPWTLHEGQSDTHTTRLSSEEMELRYNSSPKETERASTQEKKHDFAGISYTTLERKGQTGSSLIIPEYYLIIVFAILPLLWIWDLSKGRGKNKAQTEATSDTGAKPTM
ncbi:MAG TPA: hypothetical protein VN541_04610 [Tepidisphaeraceae bacterium]|nr:hypothetical protein [Tepidisphaeraceae bacterium]